MGGSGNDPSENVTPSFWNSAVRCTLPPPTTNTEPVSISSSVMRWATTGATYSGVSFSKTSGGRMSCVIRVAAIGATVAGWLHLAGSPLLLGLLSIAIFLGKALFFIFLFMLLY